MRRAYLHQPTNKVQRQPITQHRLHKYPQREHMYPNHSTLTITRATQPQRLAPQLLLILRELTRLFCLLLLAAFLVLVIARRPPLFSALVQKLCGVLFEGDDSDEGEFVVGGDLVCGAGDDHGGEGFVGLVEFFDDSVGDGDEVGVEVFRVLDEGFGVYYCGERFGGEVASDLVLVWHDGG